MIIDWARHGESCANFLEFKITDLPYEKEVKENLKKSIEDINKKDGINLMEEEDGKYANETYAKRIEDKETELNKFITGTGIKLKAGTDFEKECAEKYSAVITGKDNCWDECKEKCDECNKDCDKNTIKTLKALYVRDRMIKSAWILEPVLSYVGIQQAVKLGEDELTKSNYSHNFYISSSVIRTVMTGMIALACMLAKKEEKGTPSTPIVIYIVPYINEHMNAAGDTINYDMQNMGSSAENITTRISLFKNWLENENKNKNKKDINPLYEKIQTHINKIKINTKILESFEENDKEEYKISDYIKFNSEVIPKIKEKITDPNILAFSHGYFIKDIYKMNNLTFPDVNGIGVLNNTSISRQTFNDIKNFNIELIYSAIYYIRIKYNQKSVENEIANNTCSINSLYGYVNGMNESEVGGGKRKITHRRRLSKCKSKSKRKCKSKSKSKSKSKVTRRHRGLVRQK